MYKSPSNNVWKDFKLPMSASAIPDQKINFRSKFVGGWVLPRQTFVAISYIQHQARRKRCDIKNLQGEREKEEKGGKKEKTGD